MHILNEKNTLIHLFNILEKNSELSPSLICNDADSDHVILKILNSVIHIVENLFAAE